jgi:hypothetical protein
MADNSESFATIDQITSRPNFSSDLEITVKNFSSLVGRYHLSESVKCQVNRAWKLWSKTSAWISWC